MNLIIKKYGPSLITLVTVFLAGCSSPQILITTNKYHFPIYYSKIMTVGVIRDENDSMRIQIEKSVAEDLKTVGYAAVSALDEFGPKGLANMDQEETYLKLCNHGIDAVIVVALIDKTKEEQFRTRRSYAYKDRYYYDRIWNYKNIQADLTDKNFAVKSEYFWEAILFNLNTLEAECTIQSTSFSLSENTAARLFEKQLVKKMIKEKILKKQDIKELKAF